MSLKLLVSVCSKMVAHAQSPRELCWRQCTRSAARGRVPYLLDVGSKVLR